MSSLLRRLMMPAAVVGLMAMVTVVVNGCGGMSPFLAAQFATNLLNVPRTGPAPTPPPTTAPSPGTGDVLASVCDLDAALRGIQVNLTNQAQQKVRFAMTFVASAGTGGFVCAEQVQDYLDAGYTDAIPAGSGNTFDIGCDVITLLSGDRLLIMRFGINQLPEQSLAANPGGMPETAQIISLRRRDNGGTFLPLPELIVFGDDDPNFTCTGGDLCTQRGFVYSSINNLPIGKAVDAERIQGTVCESSAGTAPEWRLDKTINDSTTQLFQFVAGGTIIATVLDRSGDSFNDARNQVVWQVSNEADQIVHNPEP
jgi:hypothetical protein